jgi:molecular chaperone DnaJ
MPTYYQILSVSATADREEIKVAFKKLALRLHPDKNPDNPLAEEQFKLVNEAYQVLSNERKRAMYDLSLQYGAQSALPQYPEHPTEDEEQPYQRYRRPPHSYGRPRYAPSVEFEPSQVRKMGILLAVFFVFF